MKRELAFSVFVTINLTRFNKRAFSIFILKRHPCPTRLKQACTVTYHISGIHPQTASSTGYSGQITQSQLRVAAQRESTCTSDRSTF